MKARVKATGEIVEINESSTIYDARLCQVYNASELENVSDIDTDYWTRLEHQYAGMAMQGILMNEKMMLDLHQAFGKNESMDITVSEFAVDIAHTLVEKMKEERK